MKMDGKIDYELLYGAETYKIVYNILYMIDVISMIGRAVAEISVTEKAGKAGQWRMIKDGRRKKDIQPFIR